MDIADFLRARYDEDERTAVEAAGSASGRWFVGRKWNVYRVEDDTPWDDHETNTLVVYGNMVGESEHIARFNPARILADIAAKRQVVTIELCRALDAGVPNASRSAVCRLLSVPYADHPDYQREWHPQADDHDPVSP